MVSYVLQVTPELRAGYILERSNQNYIIGGFLVPKGTASSQLVQE